MLILKYFKEFIAKIASLCHQDCVSLTLIGPQKWKMYLKFKIY